MIDALILAPLVFTAGLTLGIGIGIGAVAWARRKTTRIIAREHPHAHILRAERMAVDPAGKLTTT